jgi:hypothetical protein
VIAIIGEESRAGRHTDVYGAAMGALVAATVVILIDGGVGAIIVSRNPGHRLGWLFVASAPTGAVLGFSFYAVHWVGVTSSIPPQPRTPRLDRRRWQTRSSPRWPGAVGRHADQRILGPDDQPDQRAGPPSRDAGE